jgi:DNA (cytosine-5)-methyltransferase 1
MAKTSCTSVDLFCGAGGMTLGFEQAGFSVAAAFDVEEFNVSTHRKNFPDTQAFAVDLQRETGDSLRRLAQLTGTEIDVVFGGPPCQGFSFGGRQDVDDERNLLVYDFARLVRQLNPRYFVMENVKGLMSARARPIVESFVRRVKRAGYLIVEPIRILNAADYGVPQRRSRSFIIGYRKGLAAPEYPEPEGCLSVMGRPFSPVVRDAISDLPTLERFKHLFEQDEFDRPLVQTDNPYASLMRGTNQIDESRTRGANGVTLTGCLRTKHTKDTVRRFRSTPQGTAESVSRYIRLAWNEVAPTIRAGTGVDRGSHTAPRPIHPRIPRCISAREAARLHSLPDWFRFHGTRWHDFRQIGNSVPPLLARAIAKAILAVT